MLWKPVVGALATAEDFATARSLFLDLRRLASWNPWIKTDRADEIESARTVMGQWTRAEPGFCQMTDQELDEWMASLRVELKQQSAERERQENARAERYDQRRHEARLAMLEQESILAAKLRERDELRLKTLFPLMDDRRRAAEVTELNTTISAIESQIAALRAEVGEPETVIDANGRLPADRRKLALRSFRYWRQRQVQRLREQVAQLEMETNSAARDKRSKLRIELSIATSKLDVLPAMPPLEATEMCADCQQPASWHTWRLSGGLALLGAGPCAAWPGSREQACRVRELLSAMIARLGEQPPPPKPQPLAVIPSGTPIAEVIAELTRIQTRHPDAEVRRGNRNRWEIWPAPTSTSAGGAAGDS